MKIENKKVGMKIQKNGGIFFFLIALAFTSSPLLANIDLYEFSNEENELRYKSLTKELRCPKCQNQDIADSNAPIASDMRREVHRLLEAGQDDHTIVGFMVDRFGEFVHYKPTVKPATYLLWYGPWALLVFGVVVIVFMVGRRASNQKQEASEKVAQEDNDKQDKEKQSNGKKSAVLDQHEQVEQLLSRFKDD
jgi:cytochrome c-type biogenesis protein CcmH